MPLFFTETERNALISNESGQPVGVEMPVVESVQAPENVIADKESTFVHGESTVMRGEPTCTNVDYSVAITGIAARESTFVHTPLPSIIALREALAGLRERIARGKQWLLDNPWDVKALPVGEAPQCRGCGNPTKCGVPERVQTLGMALLPDCVTCIATGYCPQRRRVNASLPEEARWEGISEAGQGALGLYRALSRANRHGTRIMAADHLITKYEQEGDDAAVAHCILTLTEEWGKWERAQQEVKELSGEG